MPAPRVPPLLPTSSFAAMTSGCLAKALEFNASARRPSGQDAATCWKSSGGTPVMRMLGRYSGTEPLPKVKSWGRVLAEGVYHQIQDGADTGPVLVGDLG